MKKVTRITTEFNQFGVNPNEVLAVEYDNDITIIIAIGNDAAETYLFHGGDDIVIDTDDATLWESQGGYWESAVFMCGSEMLIPADLHPTRAVSWERFVE